jgi:hypothetical protein
MRKFEIHFGLKLAASAIRNLTSVLRDIGDLSTEAAIASLPNDLIHVDADVSESEYPICSTVLKRGNGSRLLAVWREPAFWDRDNGRALEAQSVPAKVSFGRTCRSIRLYDVLVSPDPISTSSDESVSIALGDHVQPVECAL